MSKITMPERTCQRPGCGRAIPSRKRQDARWCSRSCESKARRAARRKADFEAANPDTAELLRAEDQSLADLYGNAGPPRDWRDDPRNFSDYGDVPGDVELAAEIDAEHLGDEHGSRFSAMVQADTGQRNPRWSWSDLKKVYTRNPGVELPGITRERTDRHRAGQATTQARLRNTTGQPQNRFNAVTKGVVASRGTESRRLNHRYATADPRPVPQRQSFDFQAESVNGGPYRQGRPAGQGSRRPDAWAMTDGW